MSATGAHASRSRGRSRVTKRWGRCSDFPAHNSTRWAIIIAKLRIAVIGAGYWGPNLARNFDASPHWNFVAICDRDLHRAQVVADCRGRVTVVTELDELLAADNIDAVAIEALAWGQRSHEATPELSGGPSR